MIFALTTLFTPFFLNISETKRIITSKMVQNVRMNPYFDISSKTQICQKCHLRPYCIQPSMYKVSQLPKNEKFDSLPVPVIRFKGEDQLVYFFPISDFKKYDFCG